MLKIRDDKDGVKYLGTQNLKPESDLNISSSEILASKPQPEDIRNPMDNPNKKTLQINQHTPNYYKQEHIIHQ